MTDRVSVSREIRAPADTVWALISDVTRMGEWSPENQGARWLKGAHGPTPGATFKGDNRVGKRRWSTVGTVVEAAPGRTLAFEIKSAGMRVARWLYEIEPTADGCRVTESFVDQRGPFVKAVGGLVTGVSDRNEHNRKGMEQTLLRLADSAESAAAPR